jgi:hypothetical protein
MISTLVYLYILENTIHSTMIKILLTDDIYSKLLHKSLSTITLDKRDLTKNSVSELI